MLKVPLRQWFTKVFLSLHFPLVKTKILCILKELIPLMGLVGVGWGRREGLQSQVSNRHGKNFMRICVESKCSWLKSVRENL